MTSPTTIAGDARHALHRSGLPVGLLGAAGTARARVALRRPARLARRDDRAARGRGHPRRRLGRGRIRGATRRVSRPLRDAVRAQPEGPRGWYLTGMPFVRRFTITRSGERMGHLAGASPGELHDAAPT